MTGNIEVSTFIGYQINSEYHDEEEIEELGNQLEQYLHNRNVTLDLDYGTFVPGRSVLKQVSESIQKANVCIFDISENNPNVLFESGYALGGDKNIILLKNKKSSESGIRPPTDLSGYIRTQYEDGALTDQVGEIGDAIYDFVQNSHPARFYLRSLWGLDNVSNTIIACSRMPMDDSAAEFEDYIEHRRYGDLDALISLRETLHRLYPNMSILTTAAISRNELPDILESSNLVILGGLDLNPVFLDFERWSPFSYDYGESEEAEEIYVRDGVNDERLSFEYDESTQRATDHGFFVKRSLNGSNRRKLIIIGGAHTWGVLGGARMFEYRGEHRTDIGYRNAKTILRKFGSDPHFAVCQDITGRQRSVTRMPIQQDEDIMLEIDQQDQWSHSEKRNAPHFDAFIKKR